MYLNLINLSLMDDHVCYSILLNHFNQNFLIYLLDYFSHGGIHLQKDLFLFTHLLVHLQYMCCYRIHQKLDQLVYLPQGLHLLLVFSHFINLSVIKEQNYY